MILHYDFYTMIRKISLIILELFLTDFDEISIDSDL